MDEYLFYSYLAFKKEYEPSTFKKFSSASKIGILLAIGTLVLFVVALLSLLLGVKYIAIPSILLEILLSEGLSHHSNWLLVNNSALRMDEYCEYCKNLKKWLVGKINFSVGSIGKIRNRTLARIEEMKLSRKAFEDRLDKWIQIIAVPIILSFITYAIHEDLSFAEKLSVAFSFVIVLLIIIWFLSVVKNVKWYKSKRLFEQLTSFSDDLQGVLDIDLYGIK